MPDAEKDAGRSANGRPLDTHDRHLDDDFLRRAHAEHVTLHDALCATCGCCWCCDSDCCAEYVCPNPDCGCGDLPARIREATYALPPEVGQP